MVVEEDKGVREVVLPEAGLEVVLEVLPDVGLELELMPDVGLELELMPDVGLEVGLLLLLFELIVGENYDVGEKYDVGEMTWEKRKKKVGR